MRTTCRECHSSYDMDDSDRGWCNNCKTYTDPSPAVVTRAPAVITSIPEPHDIVLADIADTVADARRQYQLVNGYVRTAKVSLGVGAVVAGAGGVLYNIGFGAVLYMGALLMIASFVAIMVIFSELKPERLHREWREAETKYARKHRRPE